MERCAVVRSNASCCGASSPPLAEDRFPTAALAAAGDLT